MTKSYFPHLLTVMFAHALILMGTWQLSQSDLGQRTMESLSKGALNLQIASNVMMDSRPVQRRVSKLAPLAPSQKKTFSEESAPSTSTEQKALPQGSLTEGSEFGTAASGGATDAVAIYKSELRAMIERNKSYPLMSKRLGQTGTVVVAFTLLEDGNIIDVKIEKPSRYDNLNSSALDAVKKLERFKPLPKEFGDSKVVFKIPVNFITI